MVEINSFIDDITPVDQDFDFDAQISKLRSVKFPTRSDGRSQRSFNVSWINQFKWIEYSVSRDAAFCFICRRFGYELKLKDTTFTETGFTNWKRALETKAGFKKHEMSAGHVDAVARKEEQVKRKHMGASVSTLVNSTVLLKRRYYVTAIIKTIIFLVRNGLALRGNWDKEENEEVGLFNELFEFARNNDPELVACEKYIPMNATYKPPLIQNEIIDILASLLRDSIVQEVMNADVSLFTILFDGTKDRNANEIVSMGARFVSGGKALEALLFLETTDAGFNE